MLRSAPVMLLTVSASLAVGFRADRAAAQDTPYCRQVRARAASDADLLMSPRVLIQGIRYAGGQDLLDSGPTLGSGYQLRTGVAFSPLDFYKGQGLLRVGDADCQRHEAGEQLEDVLTHGPDLLRLSALQDQERFLTSHRDEWKDLTKSAEARLARRIITVVEFTDVQRFVGSLERKFAQIQGEIGQLQSRTRLGSRLTGRAHADATPLGSAPKGKLTALAQRYFEDSVRFEQETSQVRQLDDWKFQVTGGVIPLAPVDWFGSMELSFNLGGLVRPTHEQAYVEARADELRFARDGVATRIEQFQRANNAALEQARRDLDLVQHSLEVIVATRSALAASEAESVAQARDMLGIEQLSIESDAVFLRALVDGLTSLVAQGRG